MRRALLTAGLLITLALVFAYRTVVLPPDDVTLANGARLDWVPCWFEQPVTRVIHCAHFYPAPDQANPPVRLPVVVFRHLGFDHEPSPILYLAGGPGGSAWLAPDEIESWFAWLDEVRWPHDLVLFDQRGTGLSEPSLSCTETRAVYERLLREPVPSRAAMAQGYAAVQKCHRRLRDQAVELTRYTTPASAADIEQLMAAMGGEQWNLYGVSYGTRLAMEVQRRSPERLRSVLLDSVYPPDVDSTMSWPWVLQRSLERVFEECARDAACRRSYPQLEQRFRTLLVQLREQPVIVATPHPVTGDMIDVQVNDERLIYTLFDALYQWDLIAQIPAVIDALADNRVAPLEPLLALHVGSLLGEGFSDAVYFSVECHDAHPFDREQFLHEVMANPLVAPYTEAIADYDICEFWHSGRASPRFLQPVESELPTLILAGEMDPVTPVEWAEQAIEGYPNGYLLRFPGIGHSVIDSDYCGMEAARHFFADPASAPAPACLAYLAPVEFVPAEPPAKTKNHSKY